MWEAGELEVIRLDWKTVCSPSIHNFSGTGANWNQLPPSVAPVGTTVGWPEGVRDVYASSLLIFLCLSF